VTTTAITLDPLAAASPPPSPGTPGFVAWYTEGLTDRLGDRLRLFDNAGPPLELLRFHDDLGLHPGFERALRARVSELEGFVHPAFSRVRSVSVLDDPRPQLAMVTELAEGERLSVVLRAIERAGVRPDPSAAIWLLRRLLPALAALHEAGEGVVHGLLTPNRLIVTGGGGLSISEYALGGAVSQIGLGGDELWRQFGAATQLEGSRATLDPASDVVQAALVALALLLGRPLRLGDYPATWAVIEEACAAWPAAAKLRPWLTRALQPGPPAFNSAPEALAALDELTSDLTAVWPGHLLPDPTAATRAVVPLSNLSSGVLTRVPKLLAAPSPETASTTRRLRMTSVALGALALVEAIGLVVLLVRSATATVALAMPARPAIMQHQESLPAPAIAPAADLAAAGAPGALHRLSTVLEADPSRSSGLATGGATGQHSILGWVRVESSVPVKVYANGRLLGSGTSARYRLPAGEHTLTVVNQERGINFSEPLQLVAGQTVMVAVEPPSSK
jgi:hypothetical protein